MLVVCVETGNYKGLGREYVANLRGMVRRNLTAPYRFICITDDPERHEGIETLPAEGLGGWWAKLLLYRSGTFPDGERVLFIDLDTLILANIDDVAGYDGRLAVIGNWRNGGWPIASAMMAFEAGRERDIWDQWEAENRPITRWGDDEWLRDMRPLGVPTLQNLFPGFVSFKFHKCQNGPPKESRVVCFSGKPKLHDCGAEWVSQVWRP